MRELVFFLEEQAAKEMLDGLLPKLLDESSISFRCIFFEGKQDLEKQLGKRLRNWRNPETSFVVLRDQDSGDCAAVKQRLIDICRKAKKPDTLVRIVCRELESWYLGDLKAVETGLQCTGLSGQQQKSKFRSPDRLSNAKQELKKLTKNRYQPISGSREIGHHMSLGNNLSASFKVFVAGVQRLVNRGNYP